MRVHLAYGVPTVIHGWNLHISRIPAVCNNWRTQLPKACLASLLLLLLHLLLQELEKQLKGQQQAHEAELQRLQDMLSKLEHSSQLHQVGGQQHADLHDGGSSAAQHTSAEVAQEQLRPDILQLPASSDASHEHADVASFYRLVLLQAASAAAEARMLEAEEERDAAQQQVRVHGLYVAVAITDQ